MSQENVEALRQIYAEWARGNFAAGVELYAPDVVCTWQVPEGRIYSHGVQEVGPNFREFLRQWRQFRIEPDEFIELDERCILAVVRVYGSGKHSGAETAARNFHVWVFKQGEIVEQHIYFDRSAALQAARLSE
jgi:ketosteroid isomerase-like protein